MCKVTVVIPTYNRVDYLKQSIQSVLNQTIQDFELFIVDDCSTDNTINYVQGLCDKRIRYFRHKENIGQLKNVKKMLELAYEFGTGEYITWMNDDDLMKPDLLATKIKILDENPKISVVSANYDLINDFSEVFQQRVLPINENCIFEKYEFIEKYLANRSSYDLGTLMARADFLKKNQLYYRPEVGVRCDCCFVYELNLLSPIYFIEQVLFSFRVHSQQISSYTKDYTESDLMNFSLILELLNRRGAEHLIPNLKRAASSILLWRWLRDNQNGRDISRDDLMELRQEPIWLEPDISSPIGYLCLAFNNVDCSIYKNKRSDSWVELEYDINKTYYKWIKSVVKDKTGISRVLVKLNIRRIAIFGSRILAYLLLRDMERNNIEVCTFLDNNSSRQGQRLGGVIINSPTWLIDNDVDAVIISIEGKHDQEIYNQLVQQNNKLAGNIFSWKALVEEY